MGYGESDRGKDIRFYAMVWPSEAERLAEMRPGAGGRSAKRGSLQGYNAMLCVFMRIKLSDRNGKPWGHYLGQLADSLGMARNSFSDALKKLEEAGLIERFTNDRGETCFKFPLKGVDAQDPLWATARAEKSSGKASYARVSSAELFRVFEFDDDEGLPQPSAKVQARSTLQARATRLLFMVYLKLQDPKYRMPNSRVAAALGVSESAIDRAIKFCEDNGLCARSRYWNPATNQQLSSLTVWLLKDDCAPEGTRWDPISTGPRWKPGNGHAVSAEPAIEPQLLSPPVAGAGPLPFRTPSIFQFRPQSTAEGRQGEHQSGSTGGAPVWVDTPPVNPERRGNQSLDQRCIKRNPNERHTRHPPQPSDARAPTPCWISASPSRPTAPFQRNSGKGSTTCWRQDPPMARPHRPWRSGT